MQASPAAVRHGAQVANQRAVVTFGIAPDSPGTGYGYIQGGSAFDDGSYYWIGRFIVRASVWPTAIGGCRGDILAA